MRSAATSLHGRGALLERRTRPHLLHEIFEARVDASPGSLAVLHGTAEITYAELDGLANRFARRLRALGVRDERPVLLLLPRSIELYAAMLGILKAGGACVPVDPEGPPERAEWIAGNCRAHAAITDERLAAKLRDFDGPLLLVDSQRGWIAAECPVRLPRNDRPPSPSSLCHVLYTSAHCTSAATGRPKGVMIEHRSAAHLVHEAGALFGVGPRDRVYQGFSPAVDASLEEIWLAFRSGATLVAATHEMEHAGPDLPALLEAAGVTVLSCAPTLLALFVSDVPGLRLLLLGGESCSDHVNHVNHVVERWQRPGRRIVHTYGSTETTGIATWSELRKGRPATIGRALEGYRVHLLDSARQPVAQGEVGELFIAGIGVARGYVGLPDETRARFFDDPFAEPDEPHPRMYRTGDLARLDDEGELHFIERADGQAKLRDHRVELSEIESSLLQCKEILGAACAVCAARDDRPGIAELVAYVVPRPGWTIDRDRLRAQLAGRLPAHLVPSRIEPVADLPRLPNGKATARAAPPSPRGARRFVAGLLQLPGLYLVFGLRALQWLAPFLAFFVALDLGKPWRVALASGCATALVVPPLAIAVVVALKWALIGTIRAGRYPLWGAHHLRFWLVHNLVRSLPLAHLERTPLLPALFRLLGAKIGRDVQLGTHDLAAFDLITIGDGASIGDEVSLPGCAVEDGELVLGPVTLGRDCFVGTRSVLREGSSVEQGARLDDLSLLPSGGCVPRGETWAGSPARRVAAPDGPPAPSRPVKHRAALAAGYAALALLLLPLLLSAACVPGMALLVELGAGSHPLRALLAAPLVGASYVVLLSLEIVAFKWLLVGRLRAGTYPVHGRVFVAKWLLDLMLDTARDAIGSIHATLYVAPWYRALGAKLGRFVELSTATSTTPDLLEIDDGATVADDVSFGAARVERGWMTLARTRLGRRSFVGDGAVVRPGSVLGDGSRVGVRSISPADPVDAAQRDAAWLGSPPFLLPHRPPPPGACDARTCEPPRWLVAARAAFELLRVTLPPAGRLLMTIAVIEVAARVRAAAGVVAMALALPFAYVASGAALVALVVAAKWLLLGRVRPIERPLWSPFVWHLALVNALHEFMAEPLVLAPLKGTPFLPWFFRAMGARIGRGVYLGTTDLTEFDLVEIGDHAILDLDCTLQTRLFEERVLKVSRLTLGAGCEVGSHAVVLHDTRLEEGARLDALSLVMKGESLPARSAWIGIPALRRLAEVAADGRAPAPTNGVAHR